MAIDEQGEDPRLEIGEPPDLDKIRERFREAMREGHWQVLTDNEVPGMPDPGPSIFGTPWFGAWEDGDLGEDLRGIPALRVVLARMRYKEGWKFELSLAEEDKLADDRFPWTNGHVGTISVSFPATDAVTGAQRTQTLNTSIPLYPNVHEATQDQWTEWVFAVILHAEIHEAAEFFSLATKTGWQRPFDPHPDQRLATEIAGRGLPRHV